MRWYNCYSRGLLLTYLCVHCQNVTPGISMSVEVKRRGAPIAIPSGCDRSYPPCGGEGWSFLPWGVKISIVHSYRECAGNQE